MGEVGNFETYRVEYFVVVALLQRGDAKSVVVVCYVVCFLFLFYYFCLFIVFFCLLLYVMLVSK